MIQTLAELDAVRDECRRMVTQRSLMSAGAAVLPLPGVDLVADVGLLTKLLPAISERFGLSENQVQAMDPSRAQQVLVLASSLGNNFIGRAVTKRLVIAVLRRMGVRVATASAARFVPLIGSAVAASISFGAMKLAGNAHIDDCYRTVRAVLAPGEVAAVRPAAD